MAGSSTFTWRHNLTTDSQVSPFHSPIPSTHQAFKDAKPVSWRRLNVGGILATVYGIQELPSDTSEIACLWLLHGRGDTQDSMSFTAAAMLEAWNKKRKPGDKSLVCVCFDQRNHGSRMVDNLASVSWKQGNPTHGPDMWTLYTGTAQDVSFLITNLPAYLPFSFSQHICCGVSLGGHATWHCLMHDSRVSAGIVVIGCPDYTRLMTDRAIRSKLDSCTNSDPPGRDFVGSKDFPPTLVRAIEQYDPAGLLLGELDTVTGDDHLHEPSDAEKRRLRPLLQEKLGGKRIICLSGGKDRLVPYAQGKPFLDWLGRATDKNTGWFKDQGTELVDFLDETGNHEFTAPMRSEAEKWLCDLLSEGHRSEDVASKL
ncbi:hypothetical protein MBLNU230_g3995t1 [Neophaeotheca triangularis]